MRAWATRSAPSGWPRRPACRSRLERGPVADVVERATTASGSASRSSSRRPPAAEAGDPPRRRARRARGRVRERTRRGRAGVRRQHAADTRPAEMSKPPGSCARLAIVRIEVGKRPAPAIQMANVDEFDRARAAPARHAVRASRCRARPPACLARARDRGAVSAHGFECEPATVEASPSVQSHRPREPANRGNCPSLALKPLTSTPRLEGIGAPGRSSRRSGERATASGLTREERTDRLVGRPRQFHLRHVPAVELEVAGFR